MRGVRVARSIRAHNTLHHGFEICGLYRGSNDVQPGLSKKTELAIVVAVLSATLLVILPAIEEAHNPKGPPGEVYPSSEPDEAYRVVHPTGLSIVAPENWDVVNFMPPDVPMLRIAARGAPGKRLRSIIMVSQLDSAPDAALLDECGKVTFQEAPAYETCTVLREDSFDDPASSEYDMYFEREGSWWHVNFHVADRMTQLPDSIRQYLDTLRFPTAD